MPRLHILREKVLEGDLRVRSSTSVRGIYVCSPYGRAGVSRYIYDGEAIYYVDYEDVPLGDIRECCNGIQFAKDFAYATVGSDGYVSIHYGLNQPISAMLSTLWTDKGMMSMCDIVHSGRTMTITLLRFGLIVQVRVDW